MDEVTLDSFLGGRLRLHQPARGYRAGVDPVLLAAAIPARSGQSVLELGCGSGAAVLCLGARVGGLHLSGLEIQPHYAALARDNAALNRIDLEVIEGDLTRMPTTLRQRQFDHVIANPPYFQRARGTSATDPGREVALGEVTPLPDWVEAAIRRTAPRGQVTFIHRAERLPDLLSEMARGLGTLVVQPLIPRRGRVAQLVLVSGRKGGRGAFRLLDAIVMHEGARHLSDGDDYSPAINAVLRNGAALDFSQPSRK